MELNVFGKPLVGRYAIGEPLICTNRIISSEGECISCQKYNNMKCFVSEEYFETQKGTRMPFRQQGSI